MSLGRLRGSGFYRKATDDLLPSQSTGAWWPAGAAAACQGPRRGREWPLRRPSAPKGKRMARRLVLAMMMHETNTFSPLATPIGSFGRANALSGDSVIRELAGTNTPLGGFIDLAREAGAEFSVPMAPVVSVGLVPPTKV